MNLRNSLNWDEENGGSINQVIFEALLLLHEKCQESEEKQVRTASSLSCRGVPRPVHSRNFSPLIPPLEPSYAGCKTGLSPKDALAKGRQAGT